MSPQFLAVFMKQVFRTLFDLSASATQGRMRRTLQQQATLRVGDGAFGLLAANNETFNTILKDAHRLVQE
eukprot:1691652-Pleurochrysis_carterae.AAC.1